MENRLHFITHKAFMAKHMIADSICYCNFAIEDRMVGFGKYTEDVIADLIPRLINAILYRLGDEREDRMVDSGKRKVKIPAKVLGIKRDTNGKARIMPICQVYSEIFIPKLEVMNRDKIESSRGNRLPMLEISVGAKDDDHVETEHNIILLFKKRHLKGLIRKHRYKKRAVSYSFAGGDKSAKNMEKSECLRKNSHSFLRIARRWPSERSKLSTFYGFKFAVKKAGTSPSEMIADSKYALTKTQKLSFRNEYSSCPCTVLLAV